MSTPQRFELAAQAAFTGGLGGGSRAPAPAGLRAPVLSQRQASVQLELPFALAALRPRQGLRTG